MSDLFQAAYQRARALFSDEQWLGLEPRQITEAIYRAMRQLDAEAHAAAAGAASVAAGGDSVQPNC